MSAYKELQRLLELSESDLPGFWDEAESQLLKQPCLLMRAVAERIEAKRPFELFDDRWDEALPWLLERLEN